jgi:FkbM family methyltransferase
MRRAIAAARLGFLFYGTTRTRFPKAVRLCGKRQVISVPQEGGYLSDVIDVWLDDDYGLRAADPSLNTILDVGANVGVFSLWAAHHFPSGTVHAYEPNPRVIPHLKMNLSGSAVQLFPTGLGAKSGAASIIDCGESRLASTSLSAEGSIRVEPLALAVSRLGGSVDLMKIDCEGAEWDLFEDQESFTKVREIRMEYHLSHQHSVYDLRAKVEQLGFSILKLSQNQGFGIAWLRRREKCH